jgi:hypothetical protein
VCSSNAARNIANQTKQITEKTMFVLSTIAAPAPRPETSAAALGCAWFAQRGYASVESKHAGRNCDPCALDPGGAS